MNRLARVLLGGFIVWQLLFIPGANLLGLILATQKNGENSTGVNAVEPAATGKETLQVGLDQVDKVLQIWAEWTGQLQGWSLYAPHVPTHSTFVVVEFGWDEECAGQPGIGKRQKVYSAIEPADPGHYFRPFNSFRLASYEANLCLPIWNWKEDVAAKGAARQQIEETVCRHQKPICAYLQWQRRMFQDRHPELAAPTEAVLLVRMYTLPEFGAELRKWGEAIEQPLARCRWGCDTRDASTMELACYDPVMKQFRVTAPGFRKSLSPGHPRSRMMKK